MKDSGANGSTTVRRHYRYWKTPTEQCTYCDGDIGFCAALVTLTNDQIAVRLNNFTDSPYILKKGTKVANFTVVTPEQMNYVNFLDPVTTCTCCRTTLTTLQVY